MTRSLLALLVVAACGDNLDAPDAWPSEGPLTTPEEFPRDRCRAGTLATVDLAGVHHFQFVGGGPLQTLAVRVDAAPGGWGGVLFGNPETEVRWDGHDLVMRALYPTAIYAVDLCARDADGTLHGTYVRCDIEGRECDEYPIVGLQVEPLAEPPSAGLRLLAELGFDGDRTFDVDVDGPYAYLARTWDGLRIVDVSDPEAPFEVGHYTDDLYYWNDVTVITAADGRRYALGAGDFHVPVVDVTDPTAPVRVGDIGTDNASTHTLYADGDRLYLTDGSGGIEIWRITDPLAPELLGTWTPDDGGYVHDLYVDGDRAYLSAFGTGYVVLDVADPAAPAVLGIHGAGGGTSHSSGVTRAGGRRIAVEGDEGWGAHVTIVDVTEGSAAFGTELGSWRTRPEISVHNILVVGPTAYVAHYQDGLRILDVSEPVDPTDVAHFSTWSPGDPGRGANFYEGAFDVDLDDAGRIYVADSHRGLIILARD